MLHKAGNNVINFFDDYSSMVSKGKGLKILAPRQMLQILPIVLAEAKAGNNIKFIK